MTVVPPRSCGIAVKLLSVRARVTVPEPKAWSPVIPVPLLVTLELTTRAPAPRAIRARVESTTSFWMVLVVPTAPRVSVEPARDSTE